MAKVEALPYDDRTVYSVAAFNRGVGQWLSRLPTLWVEGEVTELRRHERWATVFFTLKDPADGSCVGVTMARGRFDALRLELSDGERVHVFGRPELYEQRAEFKLRALTIERFGAGAHLASLERLKARLAAEGLFADERKRPLPLLPRRIGVVTGNDAAAKRDVVTTICSRFPPAAVLVAETYVQGPRAAGEIVAALGALCGHSDVDVVVLTRGGGSFDDLLPFSDERVVRAVAECPVPVVSAVGHEQDTPLCDLAADVRASTPTAAGKLVVPELTELCGRLDRARAALARNVTRSVERDRQRLARSAERLRTRPRATVERERSRLDRTRERLRLAPALAVERKRAGLDKTAAKLAALSPVQTLERGYAIVRTESGDVVASAGDVSPGARVDVTLANGGIGALVEEVRS
ncbi:MAG TPA: exodeoxyribonuclease VII large subunit [Gaiellaceae bacterium]|jgi:exodeoxyribonuclease VII large subunit|nr:exodeoxyribonuclease VII large subunit [Gaiellaceae bacterium]